MLLYHCRKQQRGVTVLRRVWKVLLLPRSAAAYADVAESPLQADSVAEALREGNPLRRLRPR